MNRVDRVAPRLLRWFVALSTVFAAAVVHPVLAVVVAFNMFMVVVLTEDVEYDRGHQHSKERSA